MASSLPCPAYCLNIHSGESLADIRRAVSTYALAVRDRVCPGEAYPLGLRLAAGAASELGERAALASFLDWLAEHQLFVNGINGFPYGVFHGAAVKTAVYRPDWSRPERAAYTLRLAHILAAMLPEQVPGNITTLPLAYRADLACCPDAQAACLRAMVQVAVGLDRLAQETGRHVVLALEPEPDCLLDATDSVMAWFASRLFAEGRRGFAAAAGCSEADAENRLQRHVGLCLDTCHFAVVFEDPLDALLRFERAGIRVARVQLSAAVRATVTPAALDRLAAFVDPVYLHQTRIRAPNGAMAAFPDLTAETLAAAAHRVGDELRTHFHVPLDYAGDCVTGTTHGDLTLPFFRHVLARRYPLEIETYTFDVLPPALRARSVVEHIVAEHAWVVERLRHASA